MLFIKIPDQVKIKITSKFIFIKGPKGSFIKKKNKNLKLYQKNNTLYLLNNSNKYYLQLLNNLLWGVSKGYVKHLQLHGIGYRANIENNQLVLRLGFSHDVIYKIPSNVKIYNPQSNDLIIFGHDKQLVSQVAAEIRQLKLPEPYKGKGIRYADEIIIQKEGKKK